jgi:PadR family transcriptional regulator AphA
MAENRTRYAILGALTLGRMSGYDIKRFADQSLGHFWAESYGQIYPILKELAKADLIHEHPSAGRRTEYSLTAKGRRMLQEWLVQPAEPQAVRIELLLKLFFGRQIGSDGLRGLLLDFRSRSSTRLATLEDIEADLRARHGRHPDLPFWLMTLSYGKHVSEAAIRWADKSLAQIRNFDSGSRASPTGQRAARLKSEQPPLTRPGRRN